MRRFNLHSAALSPEPDEHEGYGAPNADVGPPIGAEHLAGQLMELAPGQKSWPYHWEAGQEEWLVVLAGAPSVRTPEGERVLRAGDVVCFSVGPRGAHQVVNHSDGTARVIFLSDRRRPNVVIYSDSEKVGVRTADFRSIFRAETSVEYWDREP